MTGMKKVAAVALVGVMSVAMAACGGSSSTASTTSSSKSSSTASSSSTSSSSGSSSSSSGSFDTSKLNTYSWFLGTDSSEDTVTQLYAQKFADLLKQYSGGKWSLTIQANGTLGGDAQLCESVKAQEGVNFVVQTTAPEVDFMSKLAVFDTPCPYKTIAEVRKALDDTAFQKTVSQIYTDGGYHLLGFADQGFRVMSTNKKITSMSDFAGIKIRTMNNKNHMAFWTALGANPSPMAFSEVYTSLQTGAIDAQENPYEVIVGNKFYEVQKYVIQTNHLPHILVLMTGNSLYSSLNDEEKKVMDQAATEAKAYARQMADSRVDDRIAKIKAGGAEIVEVSAELYSQMKTAAQSVYSSIKSQVGDDLFNAYIK